MKSLIDINNNQIELKTIIREATKYTSRMDTAYIIPKEPILKLWLIFVQL